MWTMTNITRLMGKCAWMTGRRSPNIRICPLRRPRCNHNTQTNQLEKPIKCKTKATHSCCKWGKYLLEDHILYPNAREIVYNSYICPQVYDKEGSEWTHSCKRKESCKWCHRIIFTRTTSQTSKIVHVCLMFKIWESRLLGLVLYASTSICR